jgi:hypothetical protein
MRYSQRRIALNEEFAATLSSEAEIYTNLQADGKVRIDCYADTAETIGKFFAIATKSKAFESSETGHDGEQFYGRTVMA